MARLVPCPRCSTPRLGSSCPTCAASPTRSGAALTMVGLLGLSLGAACGDKATAVYGVEVTDADDDGWGVDEGDCDDNDAEVYPGAEETPGDGVDSNCDGEDDT